MYLLTINLFSAFLFLILFFLWNFHNYMKQNFSEAKLPFFFPLAHSTLS